MPRWLWPAQKVPERADGKHRHMQGLLAASQRVSPSLWVQVLQAWSRRVWADLRGWPSEDRKPRAEEQAGVEVGGRWRFMDSKCQGEGQERK